VPLEAYRDAHPDRLLHAVADGGVVDVDVVFRQGCERIVRCTAGMAEALLHLSSAEGRPCRAETLLHSGMTSKADLVSLSHPSVAVLLKRPFTPHVDPGDVFKINASLKQADGARRLLRVPLLAYRERATDRETTEEKEDERCVALRRSQLATASVVRVMKSLKRSEHTALVARVLESAPRNALTAADVKRAVGQLLVDEEYMRRSAEDRSVYEYVA
jgi:hypothetical protein